MLPLRLFRPTQSPLAAFRLRQAPTSIAFSRYRWSFMFSWAGLVFPQLSLLSVQSF